MTTQNVSDQRVSFWVAGLIGLMAVQAQASISMSAMPNPGVYVNSEGSPVLPLIANAVGSIDIEIYTMKDPTFRKLLRQAIARGVRVRVVKEPKPLGEKCDVFAADSAQAGDFTEQTSDADCADQQKLVQEVRTAGGVFAPFNKENLCPNGGGNSGTKCYEHGKIVLADGVALVSTGNFDASNLCIASENPKTCNRDYTLIDNDPRVFGTLRAIFEADLKAEKYDVTSLIPTELAEYLTVSPDSQKPIVDFINSATKSIDLEAQYLKDPTMNEALKNAAKRGVKVSVTVASPCAFGKPKYYDVKAITATYGEFDQLGIQSRMFNASNKVNGHAGYMHAKVIVVDGDTAWLGSENGSTQSLTQNREFGVIFDAAAWVKTVADQIRADFQNPNSETWKESLDCVKDHGGAVDNGNQDGQD